MAVAVNVGGALEKIIFNRNEGWITVWTLDKILNKVSDFGDYFVDHTTGIFPQAAAGFPYTAASMQVKGDPITDLHESMAAEQKARTTYDNILRFCDDYDVKDPIRFLRAREVVHYQRFGENLRLLTDKLNEKNFYAFNPSFDKKCFKNELKKKKWH